MFRYSLGSACTETNPSITHQLQAQRTLRLRLCLLLHPYTANNIAVGSSNSSFTRTRKVTDVLPSMMR